MNYDYEAAIIGGGPAGSSTAINLAKNGFNVCLFEKKVFPRETICGEFLSKEVIENLKELNLFEKFKSLNPNEINSFRFINSNSKDITASFSFNAYSLKRSTFDNFLLNQAREFGVTIFHPVEVKKITNLKKSFNLDFDISNKRESLEVKNVIAAYGKQNILDKQLKRNFINERSKLAGIKFHIEEKYFNNFNKNEIQIYSGEQIYCGINAVNDNTITLCFLENRNNYFNPSKHHLTELFNDNIKFKNLFKTNLQNVIGDSELYGIGNIYFGKRNIIENGVYMAGDAASIIAPLAGDGIGMAFETAGLLSNILLEEKQLNINSGISKQKYIIEWNKLFQRRLFIAKLIQYSIFNNNFRNTGFYIARLFPGSLNFFIKTTRS
jgi:flavin-dependent dehydrogenase